MTFSIVIHVISWFQFDLKNLDREYVKPALVLCFLILFCYSPHRAQKSSFADLVVVNAKVRTMTSTDSMAEAFAVSGNRISAVGSDKLIRKLIGPSTRVIDAKQKLVLPGFNDAHVHFMAVGNSFSSVDLRSVTTSAEVMSRVLRYVRFLPSQRWILGSPLKLENNQLLDRRRLDEISPDNPLLFYAADPNIAFANSQAFRRANLKDDSPGVERDSAGAVTGVVRGNALKKIAAAIPADHIRNWREVAETAGNYASSLGVTSVQDMHSDDSREIYLQLEHEGKLKTRIYDCLPLRDWKKLKASRLPNGRDAMVTDGCLKSFSDGDESEKAALLQNVTDADAAKLQIMIHAIGREANRIVLEVFEQAARTNGRRDRRLRVEHAHKVRDEDLPRFGRSGFIASMQPFLFDGSAESKFGTLLKQRAVVAFGSDASMVDMNPLLGIEAAVNAGAESVSVYDAVRAYTVGSAFAEFREKDKGTIEAGMLADFVILSDDIFAIESHTLRSVSVVLTVVDGKIVFQGS